MADNLKATGQTNPDPNTCVDAQCNCDIIWSLAQQFSMRQIVTNGVSHNAQPDYREVRGTGGVPQAHAPQFVNDSEVRARRIAAAYARVYLEEFPLGDKNKKGRFYWLALGAFASKQVAATLALWRVRYGARWSELRAGLGLGNLWLFNDVLAWFYTYGAGADTFDHCAPARDCRKFVDQVATNFKRQLGYEEAIDQVPYMIDGKTGKKEAKLGYLKCTPIILKGFEKVKAWEGASAMSQLDLQMDHLLLIAQHEQGEVLQGLIYDNPKFQWWLDKQRGALATSDNEALKRSLDAVESNMSDGSEIAGQMLVRALVPSLKLVLTSDDDYKGPDSERGLFESDAPDKLVLQNYGKRMDWITGAAYKFNSLMINKTTQMEGYLSVMEGWWDMADR